MAGRRREEYRPPPRAGRISLQVCVPTRGPEWLLWHRPLRERYFCSIELWRVVRVPSAPGRPGRTAGICFRGALAQELVRENPHLQVTVFDLPETIELAAHFQPAGPQAAQVRFAAGAGLLLVETLLDEEKREARVALLQSLNMLVQVGGKERSPGEYQRLLEQHGFCQVQVAHLGGILDAMLATRVGP
ncbi:putative bifunctional dTTP/UTP pyrophosphatase/methyltransferase protein isoform X2 [Callithrix jacchus]